MTDFVDVPIDVDGTSLEDDAIEYMRNAWPEWEPNEADQEVILTEALSPMAVAAAEQAALMPGAALRAYGTKVLGVSYENGVPAQTTVTFVLADSDGHTIDAGVEIEIDGYAFDVAADTDVPAGVSTAPNVLVVCTVADSQSNGLTGAVVSPIMVPSWVDSFTVDAPTQYAVDPEDDDTYLDRIVRDARLQSLTLTTAIDFVIAALNVEGVGRAVAVGNTARLVTGAVADAHGEVVPSGTKAAVSAAWQANRMVNLSVALDDPTYTTVSLSYHVEAALGFDPTDLINRINSQLSISYSPIGYGAPRLSGDPSNVGNWDNQPVITPLQVAGIISGILGVKQVNSVTITGAAGDGTLTMPGTFPLPRPGTFTGTVDT